jgi:hypothetical protein
MKPTHHVLLKTASKLTAGDDPSSCYVDFRLEGIDPSKVYYAQVASITPIATSGAKDIIISSLSLRQPQSFSSDDGGSVRVLAHLVPTISDGAGNFLHTLAQDTPILPVYIPTSGTLHISLSDLTSGNAITGVEYVVDLTIYTDEQ